MDAFVYPGEVILASLDKVSIFYTQEASRFGRLYITNYQIIFEDDDSVCVKSRIDSGRIRDGVLKEESVVCIPFGHILGVDKGDRSTVLSFKNLEINCKDVRYLRFSFVVGSNAHKLVSDYVERFFLPESTNLVFAFANKYTFPVDLNGWSVYDPEKEFERLGATTGFWRLSNANAEYKLSESYPKYLCLPRYFTDEEAVAVAKFRGHGRMPVLAWKHPTNGAAVCRSSQPLVGLARSKCDEDIKLLGTILEANGRQQTLYLLDSRPRINAMANVAKGAGFEMSSVYKDCELVFLDVPNVHVMRDSFNQLKELCLPSNNWRDDRNWFSSLHATGWLKYIRLIMNSALRVVELVEDKSSSVLVHCSDGWDRTLQITSLAEIYLDPYYRTIVGFEVLIEKEWCDAGHKFAERCRNSTVFTIMDNTSPIFLQFIECVWNAMEQTPHAFEFNERFLLTILDHVYSCCFGTFLFNSSRERETAKVRERTVSLWSFINNNRSLYINPTFSISTTARVLRPSTNSRMLRLFEPYFFRYHHTLKPKEAKPHPADGVLVR
eukprot:TRINITY_DN3807_c1_g1_i1.p1 TRINITY_DN3807_c1_g1~~TRINITY_DN3807_c1_g1_i1.p1  ORF type:complete len:551 (-),score=73.27 TRINITY_DN3807_c1_g1_i1:70-1722(-)